MRVSDTRRVESRAAISARSCVNSVTLSLTSAIAREALCSAWSRSSSFSMQVL